MIFNVLAFNPDNGVITVAYESGVTINIDLPITDGKYPEGDELNALILKVYPLHYEQRLAEARNVTNAAAIAALVAVGKKEVEYEQPTIATSAENKVDEEALLMEGITETVLSILKQHNLIKE